MKIILASGSPRRKEILHSAGYEFEVRTSSADETLPKNISPEEAVMYLAQIKGDAIKSEDDEIVISADTVVVLDGEILGKPKDISDAHRMLTALSGRTHSVLTGVCIRNKEKKTVFYENTEVEFWNLTQEEISDYIKTGEPFDKAGGYGIQGKGAMLVKKINGDYLNVVGLPMSRLKRELENSLK